MDSQSALQLHRRQHLVEEYNVLLFGETGTGKSTLINYLTNFFNEGKLENLRIAIPTMHYKATEGLQSSEKNVRDSSKSQTSECTNYEFKKSGLIFNFIDTPGLSDTEGRDKDDENIINIMIAAGRKATMAAIIVVINGSQPRVTTNLRNTLCLLRSSVPDVLLNNLVVVLTNCSKGTTNFDLTLLKPWTVSKENVFYMNNSALCRPREEWQDDDEIREEREEQWEKSMKSICKLIQRLTQLGGVATGAFKEMHQNRNRIKSELDEILREVKKIQSLHNELKAVEKIQQDISSDIEKFSNYKRKTQIEYTEMEECGYYNTICSSCSKVCYKDWASSSSFIGFLSSEFFSLKTAVQAAFGYTHCDKCSCKRTAHFEDTKRPVKKN